MKKASKLAFVIPLIFTLSIFATTQQSIASSQKNSERADVQQFINNMVKKHDFDKNELNKLFDQVTLTPAVTKKMDSPYEAKPWHVYRQTFMQPKRIDQGIEFWKNNEETLARAEKEFGVPANIIVAIIGVETFYGQHQGNHRVIDAIATLAFEYPRRADYFTRELEAFLLLSRENDIGPLDIYGSYAGAIGQPQFMPSSYRAYAVDFTGSGTIDLRGNVEDAIGSVANYFKQHGWKPGQPVTVPAIVSGKQYTQLDYEKLRANHTMDSLAKHGVKPKNEADVDNNPKANLISLQGEAAEEYWIGFENFYVITRYNVSKHYAMAVHQLAEELAKQKSA